MRKVDWKIKCKTYRIKGKCNLIQNKHRKARVQLDPDPGLGLMRQEEALTALSSSSFMEILQPDGQVVHRVESDPEGKSRGLYTLVLICFLEHYILFLVYSDPETHESMEKT